jgi:hypothetical protein
MSLARFISRRKLIALASGGAAVGSIFRFVDKPAAWPRQAGGVNRNSAPSELKITDMRAIRIASNFDYPIIRIDTNQESTAWVRSATRVSKAWRWS